MTNSPGTLSIFFCGVLGALAPEIARLYRLRRKLKGARFPAGYWLISALYAALGGALAVILPATTRYAAFAAGVTLPVAISVLIRTRKAPGPAPSTSQPAAPSARSLLALLRTHAAGLFGG